MMAETHSIIKQRWLSDQIIQDTLSEMVAFCAISVDASSPKNSGPNDFYQSHQFSRDLSSSSLGQTQFSPLSGEENNQTCRRQSETTFTPKPPQAKDRQMPGRNPSAYNIEKFNQCRHAYLRYPDATPIQKETDHQSKQSHNDFKVHFSQVLETPPQYPYERCMSTPLSVVLKKVKR